MSIWQCKEAWRKVDWPLFCRPRYLAELFEVDVLFSSPESNRIHRRFAKIHTVCCSLHSTLPPEVVYELVLGDFFECCEVTFVFNPGKIERNSRDIGLVSCRFLRQPYVLTVKLTPNHHAIICTRCFLFVIKTTQRCRLTVSPELRFPASSGKCLMDTSIAWRVGPTCRDTLLPRDFVHRLSCARLSYLAWHKVVFSICCANMCSRVGLVTWPARDATCKSCEDFCIDENAIWYALSVGALSHREIELEMETKINLRESEGARVPSESQVCQRSQRVDVS